MIDAAFKQVSYLRKLKYKLFKKKNNNKKKKKKKKKTTTKKTTTKKKKKKKKTKNEYTHTRKKYFVCT